MSEKALELDDLTLRLDSVRILPASNGTPRRKLLQRSSSLALDEPLQRSPALRHSPTTASGSDSLLTAEAALQAERTGAVLKQALLSARKDQPLFNRSACGSKTVRLARPAADIQLAFSQGPITGDRLPRPRRFVPPPPATPSIPSTPKASSTTGDVVELAPAAPTPLLTTPSGFAAASLPPLSPFATSTPIASASTAKTSASSAALASFTAADGDRPTFGVPSAPFSIQPPGPPVGPPASAIPVAASSTGALGVSPSFGATAVPPPVFPSLTLKAAPQISFATPVSAPSPAVTSNTSPASRGSASRQTSSRHHTGAVQLKPTTGQPVPAASTFDWGPLPSNLANGTAGTSPVSTAPVKPVVPSSFSFASASPAATPSKPPATTLSFASAASAASTSTPTKSAAPSFSFASTTPATTPATKPAFSFATTTPAGTPTSKAPFSFAGFGSTTPAPAAQVETSEGEEEDASGEAEDDEEDWEGEDGEFGDEDYDEDEEGLDTISEANEEEDE